MPHTYKKNDIFYDVESLQNVFTTAWYYPKNNHVILSYIDDDGIIQSDADLDTIKNKIYAIFPHLEKDGLAIYFEDISKTGQYKPPHTFEPGLQTFAKRMGLANERTYSNCPVNLRDQKGGGRQYPEHYYPVKDTDPDYDPDQHGYLFGYNSASYDMTILAYLLGNQPSMMYKVDIDPDTRVTDPYGDGTPLTAAQLRAFNDELFTPEWKSSMHLRLAGGGNVHGFNDRNFKDPTWILRKAWLLSGRYIDVSKLNEKLQKVALKRLLGMLGLHIMESDKLEAHNNRVTNLDEFAELFAYNISDVVNLQTLFEHKVYQNAFNVRGQLLKNFPAAVYAQKKPQGFNSDDSQYKAKGADEYLVDDGNYLNVRRDRLIRDSTSAKFVEYAIAPYKPIKDIEKVSFLYPSEQEAKKLGIERTDILEDTKRFFEENVTNDPESEAYQDFMDVYRFYDSIRGRNFNSSNAYVEHHCQNLEPGDNYPQGLEPKDNQYIRALMAKHNTNLFYYKKNEQGRAVKTSCLVTFSIGGIHGVEIDLDQYNGEISDTEKEQAVQAYVESLYPDATTALNESPTYINLPEELELTERLEKKLKDGRIKIREFVKSGSTKKKAEWKTAPEAKLFKKNPSGNYIVHPNYAHVSVGPAHHEDFTSYYPLLLSRLSVFINQSYHGVNDKGEPMDPYYGLFLERLAKKKIAKDPSQPADIRELADIEQESRKLLINAASGAGDATFDNNIRVNNAVISMRIIGQLFAYRIGQAQTLQGARVPSTNTDGLYTMDISAEDNDRILEETAKDMHIGIEPERLDRFVSKDSNNRLEIYQGEIVSAKGGTLNSWGGPEPTQSLDHAAIIDTALARYLADPAIDNPANHPFDEERARDAFKSVIQEFIDNDDPQNALRFLQWIVSSSTGTHRYIYGVRTNKHTGDRQLVPMQHYNRIYLIKDEPFTHFEIFLATRRAIKGPTWNKRQKEVDNGLRVLPDMWENDDDARIILKQNGFDIDAYNNDPQHPHYMDEVVTQKVRQMPSGQNVHIENRAIVSMSNKEAYALLGRLDADAYITILGQTFESWSNLK